MKNEALETHVVTGLSLLAVDTPAGSFAVQRPGGGFDAVARDPAAAASCDDAEACARLGAVDLDEWLPGSDGVDLATRTSLVLTYPPPGARELSVVITARNSLMTTFVLYHMLALHGSRAGELIARIERRDPAVLASLARFKLVLGGIDVETRQGGEWRRAGTIDYTGPIARTTQGVPIRVDDPGAPVEVRLTFARADWRLDAVRLGTRVASDLSADEIRPEAAPEEQLVTLPGDEHTFRFTVGERDNASYFLKSRGWYYEWIRREWLDDEDAEKAAAYLADPAEAMRDLAPAYKAKEARMDEIFERSRFRKAGAP